MSEMPLFERLQSQEDDGDAEHVFGVAEISKLVRLTVEDRWPSVLIEGELSNVVRAASGHVFFTLNDEDEPAQISAVMFRSDVSRLRTKLQNGARMRFRGRLSIYTQRSQFQLIARSAKPVGEGDLAAQFRKTYAKLQAEGLFDAERKRSLPVMPRVVGVVSSTAGAALRDIIRVCANRCPVRIVVADCRVQGEDAARSIVAALNLIQRLDELDVVIVSRGGGSAEDLSAFNDEAVARAIADCRVPVVSGVGHEIDTTIADCVADVRAATPSNAAEIVVPEATALQNAIDSLERDLQRAMQARVDGARLQLERRLRTLQGSGRVVVQARKELRALQERLSAQDPRALLRRDREMLQRLSSRLADRGPRPVRLQRAKWLALSTRLNSLGRPMIQDARGRYKALCAGLDALSPLKVLDRGYAIALDATSGRAIRRADEVHAGQAIRVRVSQGEFGARVEQETDDSQEKDS